MKLEAGNAGDAQAPLEKAVKYAPNSAIAHLDLGDCYRLLGRPGDAKSEFEKAKGIDSTLAGVHYDLGLLYLFRRTCPVRPARTTSCRRPSRSCSSSSRCATRGQGTRDDVDDLLSTAKRKQSELQMKAQAAAAAASASPPLPPHLLRARAPQLQRLTRAVRRRVTLSN